MACSGHRNLPDCFYHSNSGIGASCSTNQQPCPTNKTNSGPFKIGDVVLANYVNAIKNSLNNEQRRRHLSVISLGNDVYISAMQMYYNLTDIRNAINNMERLDNYCFCNCNYACACVQHRRLKCRMLIKFLLLCYKYMQKLR